MNKTLKVILLTFFIVLTYQKVSQEGVVNKIDKSVIIDIKATTKIIKSSIKIIKSDEKIETSIDEIHSATWYNLHNHYTASGERFHKDSLTAAYNHADFGTYLKVTNISNNESIIVKVTDRMSNKSSNRIDLSLCAFDSISPPSAGRLKVKLEEIKKPL
jgi:rare lipoprotein A